MIHEITIRAVLNGYVVQVGCQTVVFQSQEAMLSELGQYLRDPEGMEKRYSAFPNARFTLNNGPAGVQAQTCETYPGDLGYGGGIASQPASIDPRVLRRG